MHDSFRLLVVIWVLALAGGCRKSDKPDDQQFRRDWVAFPAMVTLNGAENIDALGDLHGDVVTTARMLSAAGLITAGTPYHWTGGTRVLVITGDVIDKGTSAVPIIDLLITLESEAKAAGGNLVVTLGNHEAEFLADPTDVKSEVFQTELANRGMDPAEVARGETKYGAWLWTRPVAALIDGWFFCHSGHSGGLSAATIGQIFQQTIENVAGRKRAFNDPFLIGSDSLLEAELWWRQGASALATIDLNLAALPAEHIVFGHDPGDIEFPDDAQGPRKRGQLVTRYEGRLFLIDVGMSSAVDYSQGEILRIVRGSPDRAQVVHSDGTSADLWP